MINQSEAEFETFVFIAEPALSRALIASLGIERGREATAEALAWAWEHWTEVKTMENPTGFLFRVGQSRSRRRKSIFEGSVRNAWHEPLIEPKLGVALGRLTDNQRIAVVLIHGFMWTFQEVGDLLQVKVTTVQNHLERGLTKLRRELKVDDD